MIDDDICEVGRSYLERTRFHQTVHFFFGLSEIFLTLTWSRSWSRSISARFQMYRSNLSSHVHITKKKKAHHLDRFRNIDRIRRVWRRALRRARTTILSLTEKFKYNHKNMKNLNT